MSVVDLINYLKLEGPHDQECITTVGEEDAPPPRDELIDEEGDSKNEGDVPTEAGPVEEEDPDEDPNKEEPMEEEDHEKDPSEEEPMEEEDPGDGEPMEEEDAEEDSEVSEGKLIGSEDLEGDYSESKRTPRGIKRRKGGIRYTGRSSKRT